MGAGLPSRFMGLPAIRTVSTLPGLEYIRMACTGLMARHVQVGAAQQDESAALSGVSEPTRLSRCIMRAPSIVPQRSASRVVTGIGNGASPLARGRMAGEVALGLQRRPHDREHVGCVAGLDIRADAEQPPFSRTRQQRLAISHLQLDFGRHAKRRAVIEQNVRSSPGQRIAVDNIEFRADETLAAAAAP